MGKLTMFLFWMFLILSLSGNVVSGSVSTAAVNLTQAVGASDTTIYVTSTTGFPGSGIIQIENEQISYSSTSRSTFSGNFARPLTRGVNGTAASAHPITAIVRTQEGGIMNAAASYSIATMSDSSGLQAFISVPLAFFTLIGTIIFMPLDFLGTDLSMLTYVWAIFGLGFLLAITVQMAGGRHV